MLYMLFHLRLGSLHSTGPVRFLERELILHRQTALGWFLEGPADGTGGPVHVLCECACVYVCGGVDGKQ